MIIHICLMLIAAASLWQVRITAKRNQYLEGRVKAQSKRIDSLAKQLGAKAREAAECKQFLREKQGELNDVLIQIETEYESH